MVGLRWAFKFGCWKPIAFEWMLMMAAVQNEEKDRINRFVFQRDAKAALVIIRLYWYSCSSVY